MQKKAFVADTKLHVDEIKRKIVAKFNKPLFIKKSNIFKSQNNHNSSNNRN